MSQHDYILDNQVGASFRTDLNNALAAIATTNAGSTAPTTMYAGMFWVDQTNDLLKQRNGSNTSWVTLGNVDAAEFKFNVATNNVLIGRTTAGSGAAEAIPVTSLARSFFAMTDAASVRNVIIGNETIVNVPCGSYASIGGTAVNTEYLLFSHTVSAGMLGANGCFLRENNYYHIVFSGTWSKTIRVRINSSIVAATFVTTIVASTFSAAQAIVQYGQLRIFLASRQSGVGSLCLYAQMTGWHEDVNYYLQKECHASGIYDLPVDASTNILIEVRYTRPATPPNASDSFVTYAGLGSFY